VLKVVPKGDLFRLASHSELPGAEKFESWIYDEVLPSIHENGMYVTDELLANPDFAIKVFQKLKTEQEQRIQLQQKIEQDKPYTEFGQAITHSNAAVTVNDYAKALNNANIDIGRNRLFKWFREEEYLCRSKADYNRPKQMYIDMGIFKVKQNVTTVNGANYLTFTPLITGKGQKYLFERIKKDMRFGVLH
jgi:anti-repressor protein